MLSIDAPSLYIGLGSTAGGLVLLVRSFVRRPGADGSGDPNLPVNPWSAGDRRSVRVAGAVLVVCGLLILLQPTVVARF